jgi:hypothetical protein
LGPDGTVYGVGYTDQSITFNPGEPDAYELSWPTDISNDDERLVWIAAWAPDGALRWAKHEGKVYGGEIEPFSDGNRFITIDADTLLTADEDGVAVAVWLDGATVIDACGPHETFVPQYYSVQFAYDAWTGAVREPLLVYQGMSIRNHRETSQGLLVDGDVHTYVYEDPWAVAGVGYSTSLNRTLYFADELGRPIGGKTHGALVSPFEPAFESMDATSSSVVVLGQGLDDAGIEYGWTCGPTTEPFPRDIPADSLGDAAIWATFDHDLMPQCIGLLGPTNFHNSGGAAVTVDLDENLVFGLSTVDRWIFDEGGPHELAVISDNSDIAIIGMSPP